MTEDCSTMRTHSDEKDFARPGSRGIWGLSQDLEEQELTGAGGRGGSCSPPGGSASSQLLLGAAGSCWELTLSPCWGSAWRAIKQCFIECCNTIVCIPSPLRADLTPPVRISVVQPSESTFPIFAIMKVVLLRWKIWQECDQPERSNALSFYYPILDWSWEQVPYYRAEVINSLRTELDS